MSPLTRTLATLGCVLAVAITSGLGGSPAGAADPTSGPRAIRPPARTKPLRLDQATAAQRILGPSRSGLPWHSGAWVGGRFSAQGIAAFGNFRGRQADLVTTYIDHGSFQQMVDEQWPINTWEGFPGRLNVGVSPLPDNGEGSLNTIARGEQDWVWRGIARNLVANGRGNSVVRVGWEMNLRDWRWHTTTANVSQFKAAYRRIVTTMRTQAPGLKFEFGVGCGAALDGSSDRLASLRQGYPGDDVVDLVGCDTYDWWTTEGHDDATWGNVLHPYSGPGIQDVVDFARARGKGASFAEWGLSINNGENNGGGDNAYYIEHMFAFFSANKDVVVFENYFDEPDPYIANSLEKGQMPRAAQAYRRLW